MLGEVILFANVLKPIQFVSILFIFRHLNWRFRKFVLYNLCLQAAVNALSNKSPNQNVFYTVEPR